MTRRSIPAPHRSPARGGAFVSAVLTLACAACSGDSSGSGSEGAASFGPASEGGATEGAADSSGAGSQGVDASSGTGGTDDTSPGSESAADTGVPGDFPPADDLGEVMIVPNRDSVVLVVPAVDGAEDYRVFVVDEGVEVTAADDGTEVVTGATIFCAGREQHAVPATATSNPVLRRIEITGVTDTTTFVVEALDRACPFPGVLGRADYDLDAGAAVDQGFDTPATFPVRSEASLREVYGNLLVNAQGPGPRMAEPAAPNAPVVLARAFVDATPTGTDEQPLAWFDDFDDDSDQFEWAEKYNPSCYPEGERLESDRYNLYACGTDGLAGSDGASQALVDRGQLTTFVPDWAQEVFGTNMLVPKEAAHVSDTDYLHVTFEVNAGPSARRYWWFSLCGAETPGETFAADGSLAATMQLTPFFYLADGLNPYVEGLNCLQIFEFVGGYYELPAPGASSAVPEAAIKILVNAPYGHDAANSRDNVVDVGPNQYGTDGENCDGCGWFRTQDADGTLTGELLDAVLRLAPRLEVDLYIRRDRVAVYIDDEFRVCSDFAETPLTMADGALGFGHVLYHSTAEKGDLTRSDWDHSGMLAYLSILPWIDQRKWDNLGFEEGVAAPADLDESRCWDEHRPW